MYSLAFEDSLPMLAPWLMRRQLLRSFQQFQENVGGLHCFLARPRWQVSISCWAIQELRWVVLGGLQVLVAGSSLAWESKRATF